MSQYVVFDNKGLIDLRALRTFGVSVKDGPNPIGFFGTGLKYALAVMLREGCEVTMYRGTQRYRFTVKQQTIRKEEFGIVQMNTQPLAFTTELGKTWKLWHAFREIYCNAIDEGGEALTADHAPGGTAGMTTIVVRSEEFMRVWYDRGKYILGTTPTFQSDICDVHPGRSDALFYRGVRASDGQGTSMLTYNIKRPCDLTEDRTLKYRFQAEGAIKQMLVACGNAGVIREALTAPDGSVEHRLDFSDCVYSDPSPAFMEVCAGLVNNHGDNVNRSAVSLYRKAMRKSAEGDAVSIVLNPVQQAMLERAVGFLKTIGTDVSLYPIVVIEDLGEGILGLAENSRIFIARRTFDQGTKMLAGTIFEEFVHLHHHHDDCCRSMQNFLIDRLMTLGESAVLKEPL